MTDFNWQVVNTERKNDDTQGIVILHYRVDGVDGEYTMGAYGTIGLTPDPESEDYVPFENVTHDMAVAWLQEALGGAEKVAEIEAAIQAKIDEQKNPTVVSGLPWASEQV